MICAQKTSQTEHVYEATRSPAIISHENYRSLRYFNGLDGLRCIAVLMVIWHHSPQVVDWTIAGRGFLGVDLFFIISGFLICTLLIREKRREGKIELKNFWIRRALRLMPAYYFMLLALLLAYLVLKPDSSTTATFFSTFPIYALYLSNWIDPGVPNLGITWSLATEEQFYLIWPLLEAYIAPVGVAVVWAVLFVANQLLNFGFFDGAITGLTGSNSPRSLEILQVTFAPILMGVGLAHVLDQKQWFNRIRRIVDFRYAVPTLALITVAILSIPAEDISGGIRFAFHVSVTLFLASVILAPESTFTDVLSCKPLKFIGMISYGMYLYHMFALHAARAVVSKVGLPEFPTIFILGVALTIAAATLSYFLFEKWFLVQRDKYRVSRKVSAAE